MFKGQWKDKVKSLIEKHQSKMVPLPHNMKNYFQPLDLTVNRLWKSLLRDKGHICYAEKVHAKISKGIVYLLI